eukprot:JP437609.1.p2 GENE.JP437609.1~~JP437609.1.p2  ORF type:complete len:73 (-),score=3.81 JP437609.1:149-367(-)
MKLAQKIIKLNIGSTVRIKMMKIGSTKNDKIWKHTHRTDENWKYQQGSKLETTCRKMMKIESSGRKKIMMTR